MLQSTHFVPDTVAAPLSAPVSSGVLNFEDRLTVCQ